MTLEWNKSSYSGAQNNCVEVAPLGDGAAVRDSKDREGPALSFGAPAWRAFIRAVQAGQFLASE